MDRIRDRSVEAHGICESLESGKLEQPWTHEHRWDTHWKNWPHKQGTCCCLQVFKHKRVFEWSSI